MSQVSVNSPIKLNLMDDATSVAVVNKAVVEAKAVVGAVAVVDVVNDAVWVVGRAPACDREAEHDTSESLA